MTDIIGCDNCWDKFGDSDRSPEEEEVCAVCGRTEYEVGPSMFSTSEETGNFMTHPEFLEHYNLVGEDNELEES